MKFIILNVFLFFAVFTKENVFSENYFLKNATLQEDAKYKSLKDSVIKYLANSWCSSEKANLLMDLILVEHPQFCVEIGAFSGSSVLPVAAVLKYLNHGIVFAIDSWSNEIAIMNLENTDPNKIWWSHVNMATVKKSFHHMVTFWSLQSFCTEIHSSSLEAADKIDHIDFLHLDGDYSEKGSLEDVSVYLPKVKKNGYILISNLNMFVNGEYPKQKAFSLLFEECELVCRVEKGNAVLFRKI